MLHICNSPCTKWIIRFCRVYFLSEKKFFFGLETFKGIRFSKKRRVHINRAVSGNFFACYVYANVLSQQSSILNFPELGHNPGNNFPSRIFAFTFNDVPFSLILLLLLLWNRRLLAVIYIEHQLQIQTWYEWSPGSSFHVITLYKVARQKVLLMQLCIRIFFMHYMVWSSFNSLVCNEIATKVWAVG